MAFLIFGVGAGAIAANNELTPAQEAITGIVFGPFGVLILAASVLSVIPHLFCAYGVWRNRSWAKWLAAILAVLHVLNIPIGTAVAIATYILYFGNNAEQHVEGPAVDPDILPDRGRGIGCGCALVIVATIVVGLVLMAVVGSVSSAIDKVRSELKALPGFSGTTGKPKEVHIEPSSSEDELTLHKKPRSKILQKIDVKRGPPASEKEEEGLWRYMDRAGTIHVVDHYSKIPKRYRAKAEKLSL
ncbi:MAG: hypothetical protein GY822_27310 [Deltaproteobacteria bacterium]|nr:hypothetical protein [Deltaproteobacteria bacterium]